MTTTATTPSTNPLPSQHIPQDAASNQPSPEDYNIQIDALLTSYLHLIDEYTTLRSSLSSLQAGMYQNLARANFAAERGVRYGRDYFDERMVASRRLRVSVGGSKGDEGLEREGEDEGERKLDRTGEGGKKVEFRVVKVDEDGNEIVKQEEEKEQKNTKESKNEKTKEREGNEAEDPSADKDMTATTFDNVDDSNEETIETPEVKKTKLKKIRSDPLRWFGLLTPLPLRLAQTQAIQAVEEIIPRLVTVNAEMAQVEIEVRRARKRREKAVKAAKAAVESVEGVVKTEATA